MFSDFSALWSALCAATPLKIGNYQCIIRVHMTSASLMALASDSRSHRV
jgi:hypothetical protein